VTLTGTEGAAIDTNAQPIATFTDANPSATFGDFTATIDWGDGTPVMTGTVVSGSTPGTFLVEGGPQTYAEDGKYTATVTITDIGGSQTTVTSTVNVNDAPLTQTGMTGPSAGTAGTPINAPTVTFTDGNPQAPLTDFKATINWGDGSSSDGTVAVNTGPGGGFVVTGPAHTYQNASTYTAAVEIDDVGGSKLVVRQTDTVATPLSITPIASTQQPSAPYSNPFTGETINDGQNVTVTITGTTAMPNGHPGPLLSTLLIDPNATADHGQFANGAYVFMDTALNVTKYLDALQVVPFGHAINLQVSVTDGTTTDLVSTTILGISDVHHPL
jgi:hypothetical protein